MNRFTARDGAIAPYRNRRSTFVVEVGNIPWGPVIDIELEQFIRPMPMVINKGRTAGGATGDRGIRCCWCFAQEVRFAVLRLSAGCSTSNSNSRNHVN
jgi:hypothetical protein